MKIIFLDFDGVIRIPVFTGGPKPEAEFCGERKQRVAKLAEKHSAKIVISSDWRLLKNRDEILAILEPAISEERLHTDWQTPSLCLSGSSSDTKIPRGLEILMWIYRNPAVDQFIMLDDYQSKEFPGISDSLVRCTLIDGFTEERFAMADQLLGQAPDPSLKTFKVSSTH